MAERWQGTGEVGLPQRARDFVKRGAKGTNYIYLHRNTHRFENKRCSSISKGYEIIKISE